MTSPHPELAGQGPEATYFDFLANGAWRIQRCAPCGQHVFTPRQYCPRCESDQLTWIEPAGTGTVYSTTVVRLDPKQPHNVALIDLDEGVRMMSCVECDDPGSVGIGLRVQGRIERHGQQARIVFRPVGDER